MDDITIFSSDAKLCYTEANRLDVLETIITEGVDHFIATGLALAEIKESRLYRATHSSFDNYVRERWNMAARTAYQTIRNSNTARLLDGLPLPKSDNVLRVLSELPKDEQRSAWIEALKMDERITADDLRLLLQRFRRKTHNHQPLARLQDTECPKCMHIFTPLFAERASRGDRRPSWAVSWAASKLGSGLTALDFGCGRMRNVDAISNHFKLVGVADTALQLERVSHLTSIKTYNVASELPNVDICFCISILHILDDVQAAKACERMAAISKCIVVEYPHGARHYKGRVTANFYREPDDMMVSSWLPGWFVKHKKSFSYSYARIYEKGII